MRKWLCNDFLLLLSIADDGIGYNEGSYNHLLMFSIAMSCSVNISLMQLHKTGSMILGSQRQCFLLNLTLSIFLQ